GGMSGEVKNLILLKERLRPGQTWTVAGLGRFQLPLSAHAMAMGGHVRVGIEDNIYYRKGELAKSNAQLVERVVRIAKELDRAIATVQQAREILGI
ncbi:MAG: 3-keto-5-aminohexanoate cleavage protein, partial [Desulfobacterales bacterium]